MNYDPYLGLSSYFYLNSYNEPTQNSMMFVCFSLSDLDSDTMEMEGGNILLHISQKTNRCYS